MNKKLSDLVQIISGYSFRGAVPYSQHGEYRVIQGKDINENAEINFINLNFVDLKKENMKALLKENDILLSIRGTESSGLKVGIFKNQQNTIATSSFFILRIKNKQVLANYLFYYLNSRFGQNALKNIMFGATVKTISKKDVGNVEISVPPLKKQILLINTLSNLAEQSKLLSKKIKLLNFLTDNIISTHQ